MSELITLVFNLARELKATLEVLLKIQKNKHGNEWVDNDDAINLLNISKRTLLRRRNSGQLPFSKVDGRIYYKLKDIDSLLKKYYNQKS